MRTVTVKYYCAHGIDWSDDLQLHHLVCRGGSKHTISESYISDKLIELGDRHHDENLNGLHENGFCKACADNYVIWNDLLTTLYRPRDIS